MEWLDHENGMPRRNYLSCWLMDGWMDWLPLWLTLLLLDWLPDCLFDWWTDWLPNTDTNTNWLIDWLIECVIDWLCDWLRDWLCDWLRDSLRDWLISLSMIIQQTYSHHWETTKHYKTRQPVFSITFNMPDAAFAKPNMSRAVETFVLHSADA
jgi:hypothetical protein